MTLKSIAMLVPLSFAFAFACGSTDSKMINLGALGGEAGDNGSGGSREADDKGGTGGASDSAASGAPAAGEGAVAGASEGGSAGIKDQDIAGQGGASGAGDVPDEVAGGGQSAGAAGGGGALPEEPPLGARCTGCTATPLGSPTWELVGAVMAAGTIGSIETDAQPFLDFIGPILAPNHTYKPDQNVFGPGAPHTGPYLDEAFAAFSAANVTVKQSFTTTEFTAPSGVMLAFNAVPSDSAPYGSSPDFATGPIIPNALFPLVLDGDLYRDGVLYDPYYDGSFNGFDTWTPPLAVSGSSHSMFWFEENSSFVPDVTPEGSYQFRISLLDGTGSGWAITVPFTVSGDSTSIALQSGAAKTSTPGTSARRARSAGLGLTATPTSASTNISISNTLSPKLASQ
jgi:hypothetical protein